MNRDFSEKIQTSPAPPPGEAQFQAIFEGAAIGIVLVEMTGRPVKCNRAMQEILGYTEAELASMKITDFTHPEDIRGGLELYQSVVSGMRNHYQVEKRYIRKDGQVVWARLTVSPFQSRDGSQRLLIGMVEDITRRKKAEESLREIQERELRSREHFTRALLNAEEQERQRLAAELHDSLGQNLSIINNNAYLASRQPGLPQAVAENLKAISEAAAETIAEVRQLVLNLRPLQIEQLGLTDSIRELVEKIARSTPINLNYRVEDIDDTLQGNSATHLYRIVQEALNNLIKHSGANSATFALERDIHSLRLHIQDDGRGFHLERALTGCGFGLKSMSERAQMLDGRLHIKSSPGAGTELTIELPVSEQGQKQS